MMGSTFQVLKPERVGEREAALVRGGRKSSVSIGREESGCDRGGVVPERREYMHAW